MRTKTWRNEYHYGGICRVRWNEKNLIIAFDEDELPKKLIAFDENWERKALNFLEENTSCYWAEVIMNYIKSKRR